MKKTYLLNSEISEVVARLGHTDLLVIADSGLPIPDGVKRIDIALTKGIPSFKDTLNTVLTELGVEKAYIAKEMIDKNNDLYLYLLELFGEKLIIISHEDLKAMSKNARAIIRTGEYKPYANIILESGVEF
ncbi:MULTISPECIES: D-ribose pyranase [Thermoanaerobacter]|jgi:D-ribose pyranase|uniref:D-ribose pyranase n=3 Tax=Thermoanaerobacter TaxID=1754 RepID=RBSD_THEP3|nr:MULTISPECIES: D-ribose pyranase [Thermoanaerobacter]B0K1M3.1 RecName: Full=D-ribose pyranase [Thermoanaerobacter sp. X514]B0KDE7.1 RecName: Full=D-ribose pyranase [Thermoanaerobacter pseudethanolicus ATCC 33223]KUJ90337.1 MAG: RbsD or FucU transport protein [Thermoanaerobacter thermocopriae]ABY91482.1 RbsD or FucU transport [Thermoanaerobacter sp. X514]ABY95666.1 RbsD or FucU transport [Thermoanaerobacter pseudethanolicus ATCC 33223]ADV80598.1 RbsD or FucU transport [Thermoanaerobacter bro